ncbi:TPA: hypothetical protein ANIA_11663 [Aspergillus nidulans FGSC A4]|uniref:Uncharacterized protein n=1 Tax=Emericella nidulans (strain FGSC A4 / ATCC 38163 / CBS 112.46 / NRRL 194 / M139) TaxID=227321 RepID=C8VLV3_EMENI|nr:TPA: hypothetical protein ANIA_11663 [Aspergillus nidulans FGSC A4]
MSEKRIIRAAGVFILAVF